MYPQISKNIQQDIAKKVEFTNFYNKEGLYNHQEFVRRYLSPFTPYRGLFLFHSLGSGKSMACISVAMDHHFHDGKKCLIVTKGDSGTENFRRQIQQYLSMCGSSFDPRRIFEMDHYISLCNKVSGMEDDQLIERFSNRILVFDEIHNVRKFGEADGVYNSVLRIIRLTKNTKTMLATATPMINEVSQVESTLRLLSDDPRGMISFNAVVKNKPRIRYKEGEVVYSTMEGHQKLFYLNESSRGVPSDIYRNLVHASLFCFGDGTFGSDVVDRKMRTEKISKTISPATKGGMKRISFTRYSVEDGYELTGERLRHSSCKYHTLMEIVECRNKRYPVFVFVEEIRGSGLLLLTSILEEHGYKLYCGEGLRTIEKGVKRYTFCVGSPELSPNNTDRLEGFNSPENINGEYVCILLGSKVIGESITLLNVKQFHAITPHWNDSTIEQAMGRVIRSNSHASLPEDERVVDIYIHAAIVPDEDSADIIKLDTCSEKQKNISAMENVLKEMAVDRRVSEGMGSDADTFILYYMEKYMDLLVPLLESTFEEEMNLGAIVRRMGYHKDIVSDLLVRVAMGNVVVKGKYLREDNGSFFLTDDPSLPLNHMRTPGAVLYPKRDRRKFEVNGVGGNMLETLRSKDISWKISFFEKEFLRKDVLEFFSNLFLALEGRAYHIMCYREKDTAYTAMLPVPREPGLKTRVFEDGMWSYIADSDHEGKVLAMFQERIDSMMKDVDKHKLFGIISVIDNKMRLRIRGLENTRSAMDKRYVKKGKSLASMSRLELSHVAALVYGDSSPPRVLRGVMDGIEEYIIKNGLFTVL